MSSAGGAASAVSSRSAGTCTATPGVSTLALSDSWSRRRPSADRFVNAGFAASVSWCLVPNAPRRSKRHRVDAWVNELDKLEVTIPKRVWPFDEEAFLASHPELRKRFAANAERAEGLRRHGELVIGEIYAHFVCGAPSRRGLIVSLRAFANDLDDADR